MTKLFAVGGAMVAAERMMRRKRALKSTANLDDELPVAGISDVDPVPLMGMGEAADPDALEHAHHDIPDQRARMPRSS